jgi:hypothetical protein
MRSILLIFRLSVRLLWIHFFFFLSFPIELLRQLTCVFELSYYIPGFLIDDISVDYCSFVILFLLFVFVLFMFHISEARKQ